MEKVCNVKIISVKRDSFRVVSCDFVDLVDVRAADNNDPRNYTKKHEKGCFLRLPRSGGEAIVEKGLGSECR